MTALLHPVWPTFLCVCIFGDSCILGIIYNLCAEPPSPTGLCVCTWLKTQFPLSRRVAKLPGFTVLCLPVCLLASVYIYWTRCVSNNGRAHLLFCHFRCCRLARRPFVHTPNLPPPLHPLCARSVPVFVLKGLHPDFGYDIVLTAKNAKGRSAETIHHMNTLNGAEKHTGTCWVYMYRVHSSDDAHLHYTGCPISIGLL